MFPEIAFPTPEFQEVFVGKKKHLSHAILH
jgi:hypothetical protein